MPAARRRVAPAAVARARCAANWPIARQAARFPQRNNHNPIDVAMRHDDADAPDDVPDDDGDAAAAAVAAAGEDYDDDECFALALGQRWCWP